VQRPLAGLCVALRPSGALYCPRERTLIVGDLHLGRAERAARSGAGLIPPYETADTLARLAAEIAATLPRRVICLGDSFDDATAARTLAPSLAPRIAALAAGRDWLWLAGNHDPAPSALPGDWAAEAALGPLALRHAARLGGAPEVSAHFHPKATIGRFGRRIVRRCFLMDDRRAILPAFGTYAGGLDARDPVFDALLARDAVAALTGERVVLIPRARLA